jgi:hypothetical protein
MGNRTSSSKTTLDEAVSEDRRYLVAHGSVKSASFLGMTPNDLVCSFGIVYSDPERSAHILGGVPASAALPSGTSYPSEDAEVRMS